MAELGGRVAALQTSLQLAAMREFELLGVGEDRANPLLLDRLRACCLVVDVLGAQVCRPVLPKQDLRSHSLCAAPLCQSCSLVGLPAHPPAAAGTRTKDQTVGSLTLPGSALAHGPFWALSVSQHVQTLVDGMLF